ncbi:MAG: hypothetical protein HZA24_06465 [Nitrospirae bacterium]|nr:hypothetical protein [Nitrospirota bacterium]
MAILNTRRGASSLGMAFRRMTGADGHPLMELARRMPPPAKPATPEGETRP